MNSSKRYWVTVRTTCEDITFNMAEEEKELFLRVLDYARSHGEFVLFKKFLLNPDQICYVEIKEIEE